MSEALKPCPFCGGRDIVGVKTYSDFKGITIANVRIYCDGCNASITRASVQKCIDAWNRRVSDEH